ncbi:MAG: sporulation protein YqfD, partial [Clostridia bacterium]|nr:sporulation protein YqfD [Clostridia bacterium]
LKKRVGAIVGLVFFIVAITVYSLCVFTVDISGNEIVDTDVIDERITSETKLPLFNANIDTKKLEREIMSIEGISSASVSRIGTTLKVVVLEELPRTSIEDIRTVFLPIKSKYDSVITRMFVTCGTPLVKVGQPVQKGQLLIAPYIMKDEKTTVESKAGGEVYGKVWLKKTKTFYPETIEFCRTGESFTVYDIKAFRWINSPPNPFVYSEKQTEIIYLGGIVPLRAEKSVYFETQKTVVPFDFDSCGDTLIKEGVTELEGELPEDAVKIRHWYEIKRLDKIVQLDIYYEVEIRIN